MNRADRLRQLVRLLPVAIVLFLVSRVLFDFIAGRPQFWASHDLLLALAWNACFVIPFILFGLLVSAERAKTGRDR